MNSFEALLLRWHDGSLSEAELAALKTALRDPEHRAWLVAEAMLNEALWDGFCSPSPLRLAPKPVSAAAQPRAEDDQVAATIYCMERPARLGHSWPAWGALAAALAVLAGGFWYWQSGPPVVQAFLETSGAGATIQRGDRQFGADGAWVARAGDVIRTVEEAAGTLRFDGEQTVLTIAGDSELALGELKGGKRLELRHGGLEARVAPQPQGRPLICITPHVEITVLGTRFVVSTHSQATRVIVREGKVRVTDRATGDVAELVGGQFAVAASGTALKVLHPRITVTSSKDDGNVPENTLDGDLSTRWSSMGDGEWIKFDLGASRTVNVVRIAFHQGDRRRAFFDIETSNDDVNWTTVIRGGQSSGASNELQTFPIGILTARFVRITGYGNSSVGPQKTGWNSYTEVEIP